MKDDFDNLEDFDISKLKLKKEFKVKKTHGVHNYKSEKPKKRKKQRDTDEPKEAVSIPVAVIVAIIYVAAAVFCVLCLTSDVIAGLFCKMKAFDEISSRAIAQLYGYMILALLPSGIIFAANKAPFELTKLVRVLLWIAGVAGMVGLIILFFKVSGKPEYAQLLGETAKDLYGIIWLRVSIIVSASGVIAMHVISNFSPNFNLSNGFASFLDMVWDFAQGQIGCLIFIILNFATLPWVFLTLPIAGIVAFVLITTLTIYANNSSN